MLIKMYRVSVYVGPFHVDHYADNARKAGYADVLEGTEHVYAVVSAPELMTETDRLVFRQNVGNAVYGANMGTTWRDVEIIRAM